MTTTSRPDAYGALIEPATLRIQRLLPGPAERVWAYLVDGELRRKWLAAGDMAPEVGSDFELVWRNDELTDPPGRRPDGFAAEHRMAGRVLAFEPPSLLVISWGEGQRGEVRFELSPAGDGTLLTVVHRRLPDRANTLRVGAGWHMHLDLLVAQVSGARGEPYWDGWTRLHREYESRLPA